MFEISLIERDSLGREVLGPNGLPKRRYFQSNSAYELWKFYGRNNTMNKGKPNVNNNTKERAGGS